MWNEKITGRRLGYHRMHTDSAFCHIECFGENLQQVFVDQEMLRDASRPELHKMIACLSKNDLVVVESIYALGYSFSDFQSIVTMILEKECFLQVRDENLMFSPTEDSAENSMLQLLSAVSRVESSMLSGLLAMRTLDHQEAGAFKPNVRATVTSQEAARIQQMKKAGISTGALQEEFGLSRGAINRILVTA